MSPIGKWPWLYKKASLRSKAVNDVPPLSLLQLLSQASAVKFLSCLSSIMDWEQDVPKPNKHFVSQVDFSECVTKVTEQHPRTMALWVWRSTPYMEVPLSSRLVTVSTVVMVT